ncbi:MAG: thioesterase family protein, partial [Anaerolineae bacterium]|nr:thioesterase family protein [Anaerolineae bacterium]
RVQAAGWGIFARSEHIEYRLPALLDDELEITTWAYDVKRISAIRYYAITRGGELLAQIQALMVCADLATGKPRRIPDDFLAEVTPNIAS